MKLMVMLQFWVSKPLIIFSHLVNGGRVPISGKHVLLSMECLDLHSLTQCLIYLKNRVFAGSVSGFGTLFKKSMNGVSSGHLCFSSVP